MENNVLQEFFISLVIIVFLVLLLNPFGFWMPDMAVMMTILGLSIVFIIFSSFIWKEKARDEREDIHRMFSGRAAYLSGTGVLLIGIIVQGFSHSLDPWLLISLGAMVLAKTGGLLYSRTRQ
jgi:uncharacterized protein involved in outer membrane biogenesis